MTESATQSEIRLLRNLRAVRHFLPNPVTANVLEDIYEVSSWTGSAKNLQPWELVVVNDRATLNQLAALDGYARHLAGAPLGIVLVIDNHNPEFAAYDEGRLAERIMLAAVAHGLGSCIGWWTDAGRETARALLGAPETHIVRTVLSIGYPDEAAHRARSSPAEVRKPIASFVHEERFGMS